MKTQPFSTFLYDQGDRIALLKKLLRHLDDPDRAFLIIHVCGTNGKGSTAMMINACLTTLGFRVGLFTSPFIGNLTNSIQINNQPIKSADLQAALAQLEQLMKTPEFAHQQLSEFEAQFLAAMNYFATQQVDWVVLECGLGGELDATNAVTTTAYSVFTEIGMDHVGILGNTLEEIVTTKSKIIRPGNTTIIGRQHTKVVNQIIENEADRKKATIIDVASSVQVSPFHLSDSVIHFQVGQDKGQFRFGLTASYQLENVQTVIAWLAHFLKAQRLSIKPDYILNQALSNLTIPGRFETVNHDPLVIVDGAHNLDGITAFVETVNQIFPLQDKLIVVGFLKDKNYSGAVRELTTIPHANFIVTEPQHPTRKLAASELQRSIKEVAGIDSTIINHPITAINTAMNQLQSAKHALVLVVGSFYLLNPIRNYLNKQEGTHHE
ncbi:bifunctional folylpolyglutamate synthase/dihydrofolate synthase [Lentilactobacillus fungorum]|uniref:tetrahydrofolate synthase n=1 Tax=Lentilactobacillus fungorum TaxID=2201250 RepID=A0ABQ3VX55_9LACO|nr:Mur ligase family protein [Lentilactobacillus fungorum]GHP12812.1 bifunctional folylpolyglutamate synthase/dihydrofolate synthase [Lentilactobacillus fungorum]